MFGLGLFKLVANFWGVAVILSLGGYSLYQAVDPAELESGVSSFAAAPAPTATVGPPRPTPIGGFPTPAPLTIFLACDGPDGDSARFYVSAAGGYVIVRHDVERDTMVALLTNQPTRYPANSNLIQTPCVRGLIRSGQLP
jgi:hypothetical protein